MNNKQILIQTIIGAISEEAIASIYKKAVADNNSQGADFPTKFSFYISIFYQDSLIKSSTPKNTKNKMRSLYLKK